MARRARGPWRCIVRSWQCSLISYLRRWTEAAVVVDANARLDAAIDEPRTFREPSSDQRCFVRAVVVQLEVHLGDLLRRGICCFDDTEHRTAADSAQVLVERLLLVAWPQQVWEVH